MKTSIFTIIIIVYVLYSVWVTFKIIKTSYLNFIQKTIYVILTWLIPFLWGRLVLFYIKPSNLKAITKNKRKTDKGKYTDNWESLI